MKEIILCGEAGVGKVALVDDSDYDTVMQYSKKWYFHKGRGYAFCTIRKSGGTIDMHRVVLGFPEKGLHSDHINGNKLDNRRENLRIVPAYVNHGNRKGSAGSLSGYWGVQRAGKLWGASIRINGTNIHLGLFSTPEDAARAYNIKSKKHRGSAFTVNDVSRPFHEPTRIIHKNKHIYKHKQSGMFNVMFVSCNPSVSISCGYFDTIEKARRVRDVVLAMINRGYSTSSACIRMKDVYRNIRKRNFRGIYKRDSLSMLRKPGEDNYYIRCACGCGGERLAFNKNGIRRVFIHGHNNAKRID